MAIPKPTFSVRIPVALVFFFQEQFSTHTKNNNLNKYTNIKVDIWHIISTSLGLPEICLSF